MKEITFTTNALQEILDQCPRTGTVEIDGNTQWLLLSEFIRCLKQNHALRKAKDNAVLQAQKWKAELGGVEARLESLCMVLEMQADEDYDMKEMCIEVYDLGLWRGEEPEFLQEESYA